MEKRFKSIEEAKEFLNSPDSKKVGAIFIGKNDGSGATISLEEFVAEVGIDKAAELLYEKTNESTVKELDVEQLLELTHKFLTNPEELSDEEKAIANIFLDMQNTNGALEEPKMAMTMFLKALTTTKSNIMLKEVFAVSLTLLKVCMLLSSDLKDIIDNIPILEEVQKNATNSIKVDESADLYVTLFGLIGKIEHYVMEKDTLYDSIDIERVADVLDLDKEFLLSDKVAAEEDKTGEIKPDIRSVLKGDN